MPTIPTSSNQPNVGRSPDADKIHQQYLSYYNDINTKIHDLDSLPYAQKNQSEIQQAREQLIELQKQFHSKYINSYNTSQASLSSFQQDCAEIENQAAEIYNRASGQENTSIHDAIMKKYKIAQDLVVNANKQITHNQNSLLELQSKQSKIITILITLQEEIESLADNDPRKAKAITNFKKSNDALNQLKDSLTNIQKNNNSLQQNVVEYIDFEGTLANLKKLTLLENPSQLELDQAHKSMENLKPIQALQTTIENLFANANHHFATIENGIQETARDLIPPPTTHELIEENYLSAQTAITALSQQIHQNGEVTGQLITLQSELKSTLEALQQNIDPLDNADPRKVKAQANLQSAHQALAKINEHIATLQSELHILHDLLQAITAEGGVAESIHRLFNKGNPDLIDLEESKTHLQHIIIAQQQEQKIFQGSLATAHKGIQSLNKLIQKTQTDLAATGKIELATWYIDWTSWDYPVPEGVNTVNLFVGNMHTDTEGHPVIDGFGNFNDEKMRLFVQQCHDKGIAVKISLGGGGGSYDHCWSILTPANISPFAHSLVDFCHTYGLDGVDFDIEEFKSGTDRTQQQQLCGQFIKAFKSLDPALSTSLCTNAGFGPYFPWPAVVENIFNGASTIDTLSGQKTTAVDRLYIMSYYDPIENEKKWILGWYDWLKTNYGYSAYQVTVGIDDKDAQAYDIKDMAAFAAEQGFSTGYWEFDPARADDSNKSTHAIEDSYNAHSHVLPFMRG